MQASNGRRLYIVQFHKGPFEEPSFPFGISRTGSSLEGGRCEVQNKDDRLARTGALNLGKTIWRKESKINLGSSIQQ